MMLPKMLIDLSMFVIMQRPQWRFVQGSVLCGNDRAIGGTRPIRVATENPERFSSAQV
jgi:hypothetical protein